MSTSSKHPRRRAKQLHRGRHGLPRAFVVENQRDRIFDSLGAVCASKGYPDVTVEDIIAHAGVSRRTFYDLFSDKEHCFLAAYDLVVGRLFEEVHRAYSAGEHPWPERIVSGLRALVEVFAAEPQLARLTMVDVLAAGQRALERRNEALRAFTTFFEPGRALLPARMTGKELLAQAVVGGLDEALYTYIAEGETARLPDLLPDLVYCALVPYLGHATATGARRAAGERGGRA
jgi:AcrR family transcriptional regulator